MSGALGNVNRSAQTAGAVVNDVARLGQTFTPAERVDPSGASWGAGAWWQQLQPGSWRGVGFVLDAGDTAAGRRVALHEYPYRDDVWVEDLGRLPRRFSVQAFLVGDDVYQQRDAMLTACEQPGPGTLVHPTLGTVQCVLIEPVQCTDRRERGRVVEVQFSFVVAGDVQYPATATATGQNVTTASAGDLGATLARVGSPVPQAVAAVAGFTSLASAAVNDAARVFGCVRGLAGYWGRFSAGSRATLLPATATVQTALAATTTARTLVTSTAALVNQLAHLP
jgi:prophage DNA circulation protein